MFIKQNGDKKLQFKVEILIVNTETKILFKAKTNTFQNLRVMSSSSKENCEFKPKHYFLIYFVFFNNVFLFNSF